MEKSDIMTKIEFCSKVQELLHDLRKEVSLPQEQMADSIGVSKKTYIQLEKKRTKLKWAETVTLCILFKDTDTIYNCFGDNIADIIQAISMEKIPRRQLQTLGGSTWWDNLVEEKGFTLQRHKISNHYRILDYDNYRVYFTMIKEKAMVEFKRYTNEYEGKRM